MFDTTARLDTIKQDTAELKALSAKLVSVYTALQHKFTALEQHLAQERKDDRQFLLSIVQMLTKPPPHNPMLVSSHMDPFEELPIGHRDGYTAEELGVYANPSETAQ